MHSRRDKRVLLQPALALGALLRKIVAHTRALALNFASRSNFEPLLG